MISSLARLIDRAEKTHAAESAERRTHFVWREPDDTAETIRAKIRQKIADEGASPGDRFVSVGWRSDEEPDN
jgi:hypothetical protein